MSDVAEAVGTTKGALYHHFSAKEELFVTALAMDTLAPLRAIERLANTGTKDSELWRKALGFAHDAVFIGAMGRMLPIIAQTGNQIPSVARDYHEQVISRFRIALRKIYAEGLFLKQDRIGSCSHTMSIKLCSAHYWPML